MENFENGQLPEGNAPENTVNPDLNRGGGVFAEEDFSEKAKDTHQPAYGSADMAANNVPAYRYTQGAGAANQQNCANQYNGQQASAQTDNTYRQMYSQNPQPVQQNVQNSAPDMGQANVPPVNGYYQGYGGYYQPQVGAVPAYADQAEMKKSTKGWLAAVIIVVVLMFTAVVLLLAFASKSSAADKLNDAMDKAIASEEPAEPSKSEAVSVNISVTPKPVTDDALYQNKETGLLTPAGAASQVLPSIVNLYGYKDTTLRPYNEASGIIISEDGYVITNAHATEEVSRFKARLNDGTEIEAKLIGADTRTDLAVLKIEAEGLTPAVIGKSSDMLQGEEVVAIGNAGGFNDTVTVGNVSYVDREIDSYTGYPIKCIQTDAALNFGNSGGALVNLYGQVVGVVVSKYSSTGSENIGFAISSDFAVPIIEDIMEQGYVSGRARIGILYNFISPELAEELGVKSGLMIAEIDSECDVANTELRLDDIITEIDGIEMLTENSVKEFQNTHKAGDVVKAKVYRREFNGDEKEFEIEFKLEEQK
ncbi:MAG: serine protease [Oscillospiraceae bacterium]|nr:serine protease [Oscillospiraceae bacterium]